MPTSAYIQSAIFLVIAAVALFASAGTFAIAGFWAYLAILAAVMIVSLAILPPDLIQERMRPGGRRPPLGLRLFTLALVVDWVVAGLDRGRFHWSDGVPSWLQWLSMAAVAAGYALALWAMAVNRFFSSVVRIQTDRGQYVVATGPYAVIRHPGYLAGLVIVLASGPALGSWLAGAILVVAAVPFLLHRTITEDRVLRTELPGYRDYAAWVQWRLFPRIW